MLAPPAAEKDRVGLAMHACFGVKEEKFNLDIINRLKKNKADAYATSSKMSGQCNPPTKRYLGYFVWVHYFGFVAQCLSNWKSPLLETNVVLESPCGVGYRFLHLFT